MKSLIYFWYLLTTFEASIIFIKTAKPVLKMGSTIKQNHHNQVYFVQICKTLMMQKTELSQSAVKCKGTCHLQQNILRLLQNDMKKLSQLKNNQPRMLLKCKKAGIYIEHVREKKHSFVGSLCMKLSQPFNKCDYKVADCVKNWKNIQYIYI